MLRYFSEGADFFSQWQNFWPVWSDYFEKGWQLWPFPNTYVTLCESSTSDGFSMWEMAAGYGSDISEQDKYEEEMGPFLRDIASSGNSLI